MKKTEDNLHSSFHEMEMQWKERKRISMELHDTTVQNLTTLLHKTEYVSKMMDLDLVSAKLELHTMVEILRQSIDEIREIIYNLRPMYMEDLGLVVAIDRYIAQEKLENTFINYNFKVKNKEKKNVLSIINLSIFRVLQEALINVRKHAEAKNVSIDLIYHKDSIEIQIVDDGIGFDKTSINWKNFGLLIMLERIRMLDGELEIESGIGKGTKIRARMPIVEEE